MFGLIKEVFIGLLYFTKSLATTEPYMIRAFLTDLNPVELKYYPFMINLDKYSVSYNSDDDSSTKICVPSKTKDVDVKVFNMTTNRNKAKIMVKHISCDYKCKFSSTSCNSNQNWNNETCQCDCKNDRTSKKKIYLESCHMYL